MNNNNSDENDDLFLPEDANYDPVFGNLYNDDTEEVLSGEVNDIIDGYLYGIKNVLSEYDVEDIEKSLHIVDGNGIVTEVTIGFSRYSFEEKEEDTDEEEY